MLWLAAISAGATEAPPGVTHFNRVCPAPKLLPRLEMAHKSCVAKKPSACAEFVQIFRQLLPEHDCQRPFDASPTKNHVVPAIWLAGDRDLEKYVDLLSKLKIAEARALFASAEFREILDGHLAEEYYERSERAEKKLGKK